MPFRVILGNPLGLSHRPQATRVIIFIVSRLPVCTLATGRIRGIRGLVAVSAREVLHHCMLSHRCLCLGSCQFLLQVRHLLVSSKRLARCGVGHFGYLLGIAVLENGTPGLLDDGGVHVRERIVLLGGVEGRVQVQEGVVVGTELLAHRILHLVLLGLSLANCCSGLGKDALFALSKLRLYGSLLLGNNLCRVLLLLLVASLSKELGSCGLDFSLLRLLLLKLGRSLLDPGLLVLL
mmetsp:Transcript_59764/g.87565  ORF Transcript_59764/g.87565 Transcript_59764/m.87565 type:complete len:236 (-) Transcript_59764:333-1040(-)